MGETSASSRRVRTAIVAYSANPHAPASVPLIGYRLAHEMAMLTDAVVIAHRRDRDDLVPALANSTVIFAGSAALARALRAVTTRIFPGKWGIISMLDLPDYALFDFQAMRILRRLSAPRGIDYVLRVNPVSFRYPSLLPRLGVPVITGPHNGGMDWPAGFRHLAEREGTAERFRLVGDLTHRIVGDSQRYAGIIVAHDQCAQVVPREDRAKVAVISENAVTQLGEVSPHAGDARRLLYVGRLNPFKVVDIVLRALARLPDDVALTVVGDGPERDELERLAGRLNVAHRVTFTGHRPHGELDRYYGQAGVFVFPSVRESGGGVVLEAMSYGLPCLVADWGGPRVYTERTGVHLTVESPSALEDDLVAKLTALLREPERGRQIGLASHAVVAEEYLWRSKAERIHRFAMSRVAAGRRPAMSTSAAQHAADGGRVAGVRRAGTGPPADAGVG